MRVVMFYRSFVSDWNDGMAHFLRGIASDLVAREHDVEVLEPANGRSFVAARKELACDPVSAFQLAYPSLRPSFYQSPAELDLDRAIGAADLVIVHEQNDRALVRLIGKHRRSGAKYRLLYHATECRGVSDPEENGITEDLQDYDGALAVSSGLRDLYLKRAWARQAWTWHQAVDTNMFKVTKGVRPEGDLVWVGNWRGDEGAEDLFDYLLEPVRELGLKAAAYGAGFPETARQQMGKNSVPHRGWIPNYQVPALLSAYRVTVNIPRRPVLGGLSLPVPAGIFEALACGTPLIMSPWTDTEGLFHPGRDFLVARDQHEMKKYLRTLLLDRDAARELSQHGRRTILKHHTCAQRVDQLLAIAREIGVAAAPAERLPVRIIARSGVRWGRAGISLSGGAH